MAEFTPAGRPNPVVVKRIITETWFFPLAALYGALALPLFAAGWTGLISAPPGLQSPAGHAHELLFGYALAVVCGFLINRVPGTRLGVLFVLWFCARLAFLFVPESLLAAAANIGFASVVAATAAPRFMKAAKKWRNRLTGPLVLALCACAVTFHLVLARGGGFTLYVVVGEAVVLFAMLMLFFGGRLIAPAAAGVIERSGGSMEARVQPRIEGAILLTMICAALTGPLAALMPSFTLLRVLHGLLLIAAGMLAITRLLRWQLWRCSARPDLLCLGVGYSWLGLGLIVLGLSRGFDLGLAQPAATHAITIGALGTLTTCIMLRTRLLRLRHELSRFGPAFMTMTGLISLATLARLLSANSTVGLLLAATAWMLALGLLFVLLSSYRRAIQRG